MNNIVTVKVDAHRYKDLHSKFQHSVFGNTKIIPLAVK